MLTPAGYAIYGALTVDGFSTTPFIDTSGSSSSGGTTLPYAASAPITIVTNGILNTIGVQYASSVQDGVITSSQYDYFVNKLDEVKGTSPIVVDGTNTVTIPMLTHSSLTAGSGTDFSMIVPQGSILLVPCTTLGSEGVTYAQGAFKADQQGTTNHMNCAGNLGAAGCASFGNLSAKVPYRLRFGKEDTYFECLYDDNGDFTGVVNFVGELRLNGRPITTE